ncbi:hypothetical protein MMC25_007823 [Agyrium rufum]|nr:hypothetical protein [Agyrium rufum]
MTSCKLVSIGRSDGQTHIAGAAGATKVLNGPKEDQIALPNDRNALGKFVREELTSDKSKYWRSALGILLKDAVLRKSSEKDKEALGKDKIEWILRDFPDNYVLYSHNRQVVPRASSKTSGSTEGDARDRANIRTDSYLYGHPEGPSKRYRSPNDFLPHLLWLATDTAGDRANCGCKVCMTNEQLSTYLRLSQTQWAHMDPKMQAEVKEDHQRFSRDRNAFNFVVKEIYSGTAKPPPAPIKRVKDTAASTPPPQTEPKTKPQPSTSLTRQLSSQPSAAQSVEQPLQATISFAQLVDTKSNKFLYRPGELVWAQRPSSWGLAIIADRSLRLDQRLKDCPEYKVQLLSHPLGYPGIQEKTTEQFLRPWLAFSAPEPTIEGLRRPAPGSLTLPRYEQIDWRSVLDGHFGSGDAEVDASIFAARMIDESYTLFEPLPGQDPKAGRKFYNGIYLGGEKIWVNEPVRIRYPPNTPNSSDIMIVREITSIPTASHAIGMIAIEEIYLTGDIYTFMTIPHDPTQAIPENLVAPPNLPGRVIEDTCYRNRATASRKHTISYWHMTAKNERIHGKDVKGRWYESRLLMPIIMGANEWTAAVGRGDIDHVGNRINERGSCTQTIQQMGTRYGERRAVFGQAVPRGFVLHDSYVEVQMGGGGSHAGMQTPPVSLQQQQLPPQQHQHQQQQQRAGAAAGGDVGMGLGAPLLDPRLMAAATASQGMGDMEGSISDFVNEDRMEE